MDNFVKSRSRDSVTIQEELKTNDLNKSMIVLTHFLMVLYGFT